MKISTDSWHFKVFDYWFQKKHDMGFIRYNDIYRIKRDAQFNLCPYVRAILFWAPLRFLFSFPAVYATIPAILAAALGIGYLEWGVKALRAALVVLLDVALTGFFCCISLAFFWAKDKIQLKFQKSRSTSLGFAGVLVARAQAFHEGICPVVSFVDKDKE